MTPATTLWQPQFSVKILDASNGFVEISQDVVRIDIDLTIDEFSSQFRITLKPREYGPGGVYQPPTIYELVQPMTYVEIQLKSQNDQLTTVLRGFVTNVNKTLDISSGQPLRFVVLQGENYGKIVRMAYIHYIMGLDSMQIVAAEDTPVPLYNAMGIDVFTGNSTISQIVNSIYDKYLVPSLQLIRSFIVNRSSTTSNNTLPTAGQSAANAIPDWSNGIDVAGVDMTRNLGLSLNFIDPAAGATEMSVVDFLKKYSNPPWNEIFVQDRPDGPYFVFRPTPWRDRNGNFIGATDFTSANTNTVISQEDIASFQISRTDENVFNYIFTDANFEPLNKGQSFENIARWRSGPDGGPLNQNPHITAGEVTLINDTQGGGNRTFSSTNLDFSRYELFGLRKLRVSNLYLFVLDATSNVSSSSDPYADPLVLSYAFNDILFNAFEHNSALENGSISTRLREDILPGTYVGITTDRGNSKPSQYYVSQVYHTVVPFGQSSTTLTLRRGEGFLDYYRGYGYQQFNE